MDPERKPTVHRVEITFTAPLETLLVTSNLISTFSMVWVMMSVGGPSRNGNPVPPRIFQRFPFAFSAFVVFIIFSFIGSFCWLFIGNKPKFATFKRCYFIISMVFMASALSILTSAMILDNFGLVTPWSKLWNPGNFSLVFEKLMAA